MTGHMIVEQDNRIGVSQAALQSTSTERRGSALAKAGPPTREPTLGLQHQFVRRIRRAATRSVFSTLRWSQRLAMPV